MMLEIPRAEPRLRVMPGSRLALLFVSLSFCLQPSPLRRTPSLRLCGSRSFPKKWKTSRLCIGLGEGVVAGMTSVGHGGGQQGTSTSIVLVPEQDLGVVVLTNMDGLNAACLLPTSWPFS